MNRLINADALLKDVGSWCDTHEDCYSPTFLSVLKAVAFNCVEKQLPVNGIFEKHGHWVKKRRHVGDVHEETGYAYFDGGVGVGDPITIYVDGRTTYTELYCSECGAVCSDSWNNYCGRCGAKMDGEVNATD